MALSCIIVDDEKLARDLMAEYLERHGDIEVLASCKNGREAVKAIDEMDPDLVFLDVHMPGMNGFEVLEVMSNRPEIIFTTAYDKYAVQAFEKNAIDYLLKPIEEERLGSAISKVRQRTSVTMKDLTALMADLNQLSTGSQYSDTIFVQKSDKYFRISAADILFLEASGDYTIISTKTDQFLSSSGISKLEERLNPKIFTRIHRSTIINQRHLSEIEKHFNGGMVVKMNNGKTFPVSRSYVKKIREKIL